MCVVTAKYDVTYETLRSQICGALERHEDARCITFKKVTWTLLF